jgi:glucose/arabinose dehydrogenase
MDEIFASGLRNPWQFSFDSETGDIFIGDVGQNRREEIDRIPAGTSAQNFGWPIREGYSSYENYPGWPYDESLLVNPIHVYFNVKPYTCSVTGGYMYRGAAIPSLQGNYIFADYCSGVVSGLTQLADGGWTRTDLYQLDAQISSIGQDAAGELYLTSLFDGKIYKLVP